MSVGKYGIAGLRRFGHETGVEPALQGRGEPPSQFVLREDALNICNGRGVGEGWTRGECRFFSIRNIGDSESDFRGRARSNRQAATLDGGKVTSHGVHRVDRSATSNQGTLNRSHVVESHFPAQGKLEQRGAAT